MKTIEIITRKAKDTVGYDEAQNKESFLIGVSVGGSKAEEIYMEEIKQLGIQVNSWKAAFENRDKDIRTIASILNKYTESAD